MSFRYTAFGIILLLAIAAGAWLVWRSVAPRPSAEPSSATSTQAAAAPLLPPRQAPAGYQEYRDEHYRFALFYPVDLTAKAYDEGGGASTLVFQDPAAGQGFQIFVVPYAGERVSEQQFNRDEPSGVRQDVTNVTVDGAFGTMFFGKALTLGETREVWFIHGGYLFEVTAPRSLDAWLGGIMNSWIWL